MTIISPTTQTPSPPATGTQADLISGQQNLATSYQTFLTLLTTQLKNQDPTSPLDPNQFTQELVSMTGVQQQLLTNQLLQQMVNQSPSAGVTGAVGLIGKTISAQSSVATLSGGQASWSYNLPANAAQGTATITSSSGQVVWSGDLPNLAAGDHQASWNGQTSSGAQLPDGGSYTLNVAAKDASGAAMTSAISIKGAATSIQQGASGTTVTVGATSVPLSSIMGVSAQ